MYLFIYCTFLLFTCINSQFESKCPDFFQYDNTRADSSRWFGELILSTDFILNGYWVDIELTNVADVFGTKTNIPLLSRDNKNYVIVAREEKLEPGKQVRIPVFVKYDDLSDPIPEISSIRINGREVCPTQIPAPIGISPCPGIFSYDPNQGEFEKWFGSIALNLEYDLRSLYLEFELTGKADLVGAYNYRIKPSNNNQETNYWNSVGDISTKDNLVYLISNSSFSLKHGELLTIPFFVKFNSTEIPPAIKAVVVNGRTICESSIQENSLRFINPEIVTVFKPVATVKTAIPTPLIIPEIDDEDTDLVTSSGYQCGVAEISDKIIGGAPTTIKQHPWHGAIFRNGDYICGMTLISRKHAISAAHCFSIKDKNSFTFRFGIGNLKNLLSKEGQTAQISDIWTHPDYFYHITKYDIAVLKFAEELRVTETVKPVCLWSGDTTQNEIVNKVGTIVGFGTTENHGISDQLRDARILVVDLETCRERAPLFYAFHLSSNSFCAGNISTEIGSCTGDSGGGLYFKKPNSDIWEIRGITSISQIRHSSCDNSAYVIYTDIAQFKPWLREKMDF